MRIKNLRTRAFASLVGVEISEGGIAAGKGVFSLPSLVVGVLEVRVEVGSKVVVTAVV